MPGVLIVSVVPTETLAKLVRAARERYPGAHLAVLCGGDEEVGADERLSWRALGARRLVSELRRQRFALVLLAHGRDQYLQPAFWKAMAAALLSGAARKMDCPDGEMGSEAGGLRLLAKGKWGAITQIGAEGYVAAVGLALLPILLGIAVTDAVGAAIGGRRASGAGQS